MYSTGAVIAVSPRDLPFARLVEEKIKYIFKFKDLLATLPTHRSSRADPSPIRIKIMGLRNALRGCYLFNTTLFLNDRKVKARRKRFSLPSLKIA